MVSTVCSSKWILNKNASEFVNSNPCLLERLQIHGSRFRAENICLKRKPGSQECMIRTPKMSYFKMGKDGYKSEDYILSLIMWLVFLDSLSNLHRCKNYTAIWKLKKKKGKRRKEKMAVIKRQKNYIQIKLRV